MTKVNVVINVIESALQDSSKPWHRPFGWAEEQTGVGRFKLLVGAVAAISYYLILGFGAMTASNAIGFAYPAYATIVTMESPQRPSSPAATNKWFTYWLVFASILIVEHHLGFVLGLVPFYKLVKTVFLVYCFMPIRNNGATLLFTNFIRNYLGNIYYSG